jgi:hypothetical protein
MERPIYGFSRRASRSMQMRITRPRSVAPSSGTARPRQESAVPVEAAGPACLDDLQIGLAVAVQQLVSDRSGRVLVMLLEAFIGC